MSSSRTLMFAAVAALVSVGAFADSLTVSSGETVTISETKTYDSVSIDGGTIVLDADGVLKVGTGGVNVGASDSTITFNGGKLAISGSVRTTGAGNLYLNGNDGDVIVVNENTGAWIRMFECAGDATGRVRVAGGRDFVLYTSRSCGVAKKDANKDASLCLQHTGLTKLNNAKGTGDFSYGNNYGNVFENQETWLNHGSTLDMTSVWHVMKKSLRGAGSVMGNYIRFEIPQNEIAECSVRTFNLTDFIKKGEGRLDVFNATPTNLTVEAGEVRVLPRSQMGYSEYRLKIDGVGTAQKSAMGFNAVALYSGEDDITSEFVSAGLGSCNQDHVQHDAGYAANLLDGTTENGWWYGYDVNGGSTANPSFDNAYLDIRFVDRRIVTGYKFRTRQTNSDFPTSWRLFGRDPGGEWELLDQRVDAKLPGTQWTWSDMFTATIPADAVSTASCGKLSMNSGAKLTVLPNAAFASCAFAPANGAVFDFRAGSSVDIAPADANGAAADLEIAAGSSSFNGALAKSGSGTLTLTGVSAANGPEKVHVKEGTFALRSYINWKHWKFVFCDLDTNKGDPTGIGMAELAVFDAEGHRLNVTGTATMGALTEENFGGDYNGRMYDESDSSCYLGNAVPTIAEESTWKYTSFSLSPSAPAVASYNLKSGSNGPSNSRPKTWRVYARENTEDEWVLIDSRTDVATPSDNTTWYNNGTPWAVAATAGSGAAAFGSAVPVTVDPGAVLDLTCANETTLSRLVMDGDAAGYGTIRGGTFASTGTFEISTASTPRFPMTMPVKIEGDVSAKTLSGWKVVINGVEKRGCKVVVTSEGRPVASTSGLVFMIR